MTHYSCKDCGAAVTQNGAALIRSCEHSGVILADISAALFGDGGAALQHPLANPDFQPCTCGIGMLAHIIASVTPGAAVSNCPCEVVLREALAAIHAESGAL